MKYSHLLVLLMLIGCNSQNSYENYVSKKFPVQHTKAGFEKVPYGSVYAIQYKSTGNIKNKSQGIYKSFFVNMEIMFVLDNGKVISNAELDPYPFVIPSYKHLLSGQFTINEEEAFDLGSPRITAEYKSYPIERVMIIYYITGEDLINDENLNGVIYRHDVTKEWLSFVSSFNQNVD